MKHLAVPREVVVVEGRDDTKRLIETFGNSIKTIETNGSALSRQTIAQIQAVAKEFGVIVLTDPDYQGERLRHLIAQAVPEAKHAFLAQVDADSGQAGRSLGIEHAKPEAIRRALQVVATPVPVTQVQYIPMAELIALRLIGHSESAQRRTKIAQTFHLGHMNGKQLQKRLATYGITLEQLVTALQEDMDDKRI